MEGTTNSLSCKHYQEEEEEVDRISKLPDNLIHHILSFNDMQHAVQTSVLSKRWKYTWMSLPFITLDCASWFAFLQHQIQSDNSGFLQSIERIQDRFVGLVNKVFEFHDDSDIQKIRLRCVIQSDAEVKDLNRWILAAVDHSVQCLALDSDYYFDSYEIPHQLLHCRSLKSLNIILGGQPPRRYIDITLPKSISLPQIKTLCLDGISITNLVLLRLFSNCPLMEMLTLQQCDIRPSSERNIIFDSHNLQTLELNDNRHTHLGSADNFMTYTSKICAPNLKTFRCSGFMREGFSLENLSSLLSSQFNMRLREEEEEDETAETYSELSAEEKEAFAKRMMRFLVAVHNVQDLMLSTGFLEVLLQSPGMLCLEPPPQLCNLVILKLEMMFTRACLCSIAYILKISPNLRILKLKLKESNLADVGDDWEAEFSLKCMFSHLRFVEIREVEGCDNELKFLRFLLRKSTVLEKVNLFFRSTGDSLDNERQVRQFKRSLRALPAASSNIQMNFI